MVMLDLITLQNTSVVALTHRVSANEIVCKMQLNVQTTPHDHISMWLPTFGRRLLHLIQDGMPTNTISIHMDRLSACHDGGDGPSISPSFHGHAGADYVAEYFRHGIDALRQCQWNRVQDAIKRIIHTP